METGDREYEVVPLLEVWNEPTAGGVRIGARGEIDLSNAGEVTAALAAAEDSATSLILLDLSAVTFIDSTGLGILLAAQAHSRQNGNRLRITPSPVVARALTLSGLQDRLPLNPVTETRDVRDQE